MPMAAVGFPKRRSEKITVGLGQTQDCGVLIRNRLASRIDARCDCHSAVMRLGAIVAWEDIGKWHFLMMTPRSNAVTAPYN
jgi:hypothetical protein